MCFSARNTRKTLVIFCRTLYLYTDLVSTQTDLRNSCAMLSSGRSQVSINTPFGEYTPLDSLPIRQNIFFMINLFFFLPLHAVKTSPYKKRHAVAQGPVKRPAGSGPSLSTQTSTNSQQHVLQRQISSDTKEDSEGDNGKT